MTPTYITTLQFIVSRVTDVDRGKKAKTKRGNRKAMAPMLIAIPNRPNDHRWGGSASPRSRFNNTQPIETMYADMSDVIVREMMALRATCDPMLISERRMVTPRETITEFKGMFHPGVTCQYSQLELFQIFGFFDRPTYAKKDENGMPSSRANDHSCRDAVATSVMVLAVNVTIRTAVIAFVAARLPVVL